jgi:hypothetical protein
VGKALLNPKTISLIVYIPIRRINQKIVAGIKQVDDTCEFKIFRKLNKKRIEIIQNNFYIHLLIPE